MRCNPAKSQMYPFCDYTSNSWSGHCSHECEYCFMNPMKRFPKIEEKYSGKPRLDTDVLYGSWPNLKVRRRENLSFVPDDKCLIFVGSANDPFFQARKNLEKTMKVLEEKIDQYYLIQSKAPRCFNPIEELLPWNTILATTVETDLEKHTRSVSNAPDPIDRAESLQDLDCPFKLVTIEPIIEFSMQGLVSLILDVAGPDVVAIGADSRNNGLSEPTAEEVRELVMRLRRFIEVHLKPNLIDRYPDLADLKKYGVIPE